MCCSNFFYISPAHLWLLMVSRDITDTKLKWNEHWDSPLLLTTGTTPAKTTLITIFHFYSAFLSSNRHWRCSTTLSHIHRFNHDIYLDTNLLRLTSPASQLTFKHKPDTNKVWTKWQITALFVSWNTLIWHLSLTLSRTIKIKLKNN